MIEVGDYCRQVEAHLTRVNGGHLVRIVGPGFALVRQWAEAAIPLSAVFRGIEQKAERHKAGASRRPLRIEFCEADVREVYEAWRRAIGAVSSGTDDDTRASTPVSEPEPARASTGRDLDRAVDRLVRLSGRLDLPDEFRDSVGNALTRVTSIRETVKGKKGAARAALLEDLPAIERELVDAGRNALPAELMAGFRRDAEHDLEPFRSRLSGGAWEKAVTVTVDRAVRAHFGLPEFHVVTET